MVNRPAQRLVALLMTDLEGSTRLWEKEPEKMRRVVIEHDEIVHAVAATYSGSVPRGRGEGDSALIVFATASNAVEAAAEFVVRIRRLGEAVNLPLAVRCCVHAGEVMEREQDLYGSSVNRCARVRGLAYGGQVLVTELAIKLASGSLSSEIGFKSLGRVRLRDLLEPEAISQLLHPELATDFPPPASLDRTPNNLPVQVTPFVGRIADCELVTESVRAHRQVTLLGPGGVGKTRLALQAAAEILDDFPDGVWFVNLAPVDREADVLATVLRALRLEPTLTEELLLAELVNSTMLLIFDNCEQVIEAVGKLAAYILRDARGVRLLFTSRHALGVTGERVLPLAGLSIPELGTSDPEKLMDAEAIQLLVDRARQHHPTFQASEENADDLQGIVRRLDGLPLAIELAAARLRILTPSQLYGRLTDIFSGLGAGPTDALPRHRTIEASIAWSYELLETDERAFFLAMAQFTDGWSVEAAEAIHRCLGLGSDALSLLTSLTDKSMVVAGSATSGRMRILVPLREFAAKHLSDAPDAPAAFLEWARSASESEVEKADRGLAFAQAEGESLRAALELAVARKLFNESFAICRAMNRLWYTGGQLLVGQQYTAAAIELAPEGEDKRLALLYDNHGILAWARADLDVAEASIRKAEALWKGMNDERSAARAQSHLGFIMFRRGDVDGAEAALTSAYLSFEGCGTPIELANAATNLGNIFHVRRMDAESVPYFTEALALSEKHGDRRAMRTLTGLLAEVALRADRTEEARIRLIESLTLAIELKDVLGASDSMLTAADMLIRFGAFEEAARTLGAQAMIHATTGQALDAHTAESRDQLQSRLAEHLPEARLKRLTRGVGGDAVAAATALLAALEQVGGPTTTS